MELKENSIEEGFLRNALAGIEKSLFVLSDLSNAYHGIASKLDQVPKKDPMPSRPMNPETQAMEPSVLERINSIGRALSDRTSELEYIKQHLQRTI